MIPEAEIVEAVKPSTWQTDSGEQRLTYWVKLVSATGERELPCYDPRGGDLKTDSELPDGWEVRTSKAGKLYLAAPKTAGSGKKDFTPRPAAWANTEEGEKYVQERMDRRTALMQALIGGWKDVGGITLVADQLYAWLRKNLDVSAPRLAQGRNSPDSGVPGGTGRDEVARVGADTPLDGGGVEPGEASSPSSTKRSHSAKWTPNEPPEGWK